MLNTVACDDKDRGMRLDKTAGASELSNIDQPAVGGTARHGRRKIFVPKELIMLLHNFMEARKMAGHIAIEFCAGTITSVEAVTNKRYK